MSAHEVSGSAVAGAYSTVVELMGATVEAFGDREAIVDGDRRLTFAEWDRAAAGVCSALVDAGVRKGDVVCLMLPSSIEFAVCYHAAIRLGAITSAINPRMGSLEVASVVERVQPRVTVCGVGGSPPVGSGWVVSEADLHTAWDAHPPSSLPSLDSSDPVAVVWTSGTTGAPKGAVYDHDNLAAVALGAGDLSAPGDRRLSPLPFAHVGYMTRPWDELVNAITTVIAPTPWRAGESLRLMERESVTVAQGVPTQWRLTLALPEFDAADLSSLRVAGTGATTVPPELVREMRTRLGCPVVVGYTSTETAIAARSSIGDSDEDVARTVGRAAEGVRLAITDEQGTALPPGEVGVVRVRSSATMRRYWDDPELTARVIDHDGWVVTGDLGRLDDRGYLTLVGRRSDMYIRGGYNVYPSEVEGVLAEHPRVSEVAVVGVPDPVLGEVGAAFVVQMDEEGSIELSLEDVRDWCRRRLADYKAPDLIELVPSLPLTGMSKVDKKALVAQASRTRGLTKR